MFGSRSEPITIGDGSAGLAAGTAHVDDAAYSDLWVVRLDASGSVQWERALRGPLHGFAHSIVAMPDGGFAVFGKVSRSTLADSDS